MEEIINKVKESGLIQMDLADFKPKTEIIGIDIANQLWQGLILKEKDFRDWLKINDWSSYKDKAVFIFCSVDAIIPTWAYMLIGSKLDGIASEYLVGSKDEMERELIKKEISRIDIQNFKDGRIIIKGCSDISSPDFAMVEVIKKLQPFVKSIMYGEPCSTVPIFKRK